LDFLRISGFGFLVSRPFDIIRQMTRKDLQETCETGQRELMETRYLQAERTLSRAEHQAWESKDFDTLSRLYLPLQESRRQIRQRCGEGPVAMHLLATASNQQMDPVKLAGEYPQGHLLVAAWGTLGPAIALRELASSRDLYLQTFLGAVYPVIDSEPVIAIVPLPEPIPPPSIRTVEQLRAALPAHSLILHPAEIPADARIGSAESFAGVMALWERLHTPFLQAASQEPGAVRRMQAYRVAIQVDSACELAHQFLADIARSLARSK